ncbi:MAG TPA: HAMP domain-containing sensor histidine kinase [Candidatus Saccharimonadales bacterium]|nr:HAMP domain-containing sensor histidine kinase [Candidatus Saccharimonadales bacterium]
MPRRRIKPLTLRSLPVIKTLTGTLPAEDSLAADRLRELQRLAELGRLSAILLHEISNPLTAAILYLEQHEDQQAASIRHARRNIQLLQRYVDAARQQVRQETQPVNFQVSPQLDQVKRLLRPLAKRSKVKLKFEQAANYRLYGDPVKFQQIVTNLIVNAIDAYNSDLVVSQERLVRVTLTSRHQWLVLQVTDWGRGITSQQLPKLFEPFYTTKSRSNQGLGIGLTMVKRYVEKDFSGAVSMVSSLRRGTQCTVKLRLTPAYAKTRTGRRPPKM